MISKRVIFEGRVQGVGFRYTVKDIARGYDVVGWVKNLNDGTVELHISGEQDELDEFLKEIVEECPMAHNIKNMFSHETPPLEGVSGFTIST